MSSKQRWMLQEDLDGCHIYPTTGPAEDLIWGRVKPVATIADSGEALELVGYLNKLPAFRSPKRRSAAALQREHEKQSNRDARRAR